MQLNVTTDYAVRIVLYLAIKKDYVNSSEISREMGIPRTYILKLTKNLKDAGIIGEKRGVVGGFILKKDPDELTLWDVYKVFERTMVLNRCLEEDEHCSRDAVSYCTVRKFLVEVQSEVIRMMSKRISDFL